MTSYTEDLPYCDSCGREELDLPVEICRHCLDFQRQRADEAEHKLVAIRTILENYDPYETDYAFRVVRDIEALKP